MFSLVQTFLIDYYTFPPDSVKNVGQVHAKVCWIYPNSSTKIEGCHSQKGIRIQQIMRRGGGLNLSHTFLGNRVLMQKELANSKIKAIKKWNEQRKYQMVSSL